MLTTFHNITVSIEAETPREAYAKLCELLGRWGIEYTTDTYSVDHDEALLDTVDLFPDE